MTAAPSGGAGRRHAAVRTQPRGGATVRLQLTLPKNLVAIERLLLYCLPFRGQNGNPH